MCCGGRGGSFITPFHYLAVFKRINGGGLRSGWGRGKGAGWGAWAGEEGTECAYQLSLRVGNAEFLIDCCWI